MKTWFPHLRHAGVFLFTLGLALGAGAGPFQLVSAIDPAQAPAAGGSGDSCLPILSPDGRFVLFASTANNLVVTSNGNPLPVLLPPSVNVFLRDRTNGTTTLVSANLTGTGGGNGDSLPAGLSADGRWVLFESSASDLVTGDTNGVADVFIRDMANGVTLLVSAATNGAAANGASRSSVLSPDGRYVAFVSGANNLAADDTNRIPDIFVRDMQARLTTLASVGAMATNPVSSMCSSEAPEITADGRYVAFFSTATNLGSATGRFGDLYVRDLVEGTNYCASGYARTAVQAALGATNASCYNHVISSNGQYVAYEASPYPRAVAAPGVILRYNVQSGVTDIVHTNASVRGGSYENIQSLDMTPDGRFIVFIANFAAASNATTCVYLWDAENGATTLLSGDLAGGVPTNSICAWPALEASGRYVAFLSSATNLVTNSLAGVYHLYVRDTQAGTTALVDADTNGLGSVINLATAPRLSADGRCVAFECRDGGLAPNDRNHASDVFVRDVAGASTELISARAAASPSVAANGPSVFCAVSAGADGRYLAFSSEADNLVPNDTNGCRDIFVRDLVAGSTVLASAATNGAGSADGVSTDPALSTDGRYLAFASSADNLVAGDTNQARDVFVRDLQTGTTTLVSVGTDAVSPGNRDSFSPLLSANGRYVVFRSRATNLAPGSGSSSTAVNLLWRDLQAGISCCVTNGYVEASSEPSVAMTPDGRFVLYGSRYSPVCVWDSVSASNIYSFGYGARAAAMSPDGRRLAYLDASQLYAADRAAQTNWTIGPSYFKGHSGLRFSADGRFLTYAASATQAGTNQVYLYDFQTGSNILVSHRMDSAEAANGVSDSPDISSDGRFIAFRSWGGDLAANDTNGLPDLFLWDRLTGTTTLLTASRYGAASADGRSLPPLFSGDGRRLFLSSWASDLVAGDANGAGDVFSYALFYAVIVPGTQSAPGVLLTWPAVPGTAYTVQFKDRLDDPSWQESTNITVVGSQASYRDPSPGAGKRFYRIVAH